MSVWASGSDAAELACLRVAGFWPVGRASGCVVLNFGWWSHEIGSPRRLRERYPQGYGNLDLGRRSEAYAGLLYQGQRAALARMAAQCSSLGGDGVVGVRIDVAPYPGDGRARQFTAADTTVRAEGVAEATLIGTAITQFRPSPSSQVLPAVATDLRAKTETSRNTHPAPTRDTGKAIFSLPARLSEELEILLDLHRRDTPVKNR
jgi:uncharacterized protein YbjQ (UPF0145 family)